MAETIVHVRRAIEHAECGDRTLATARRFQEIADGKAQGQERRP